MNVTLPENKIDKKSVIIYCVIIGICIVSIGIVLYLQFIDGKTVESVGTLKGKSTYDYDVLKSEFEEIFTNKLENEEEKFQNKKEDKSKRLVYTSYQKKETSDGDYDIDACIPYINIKSEQAQKYNQEIQNTFINKSEVIAKSINKNNIYSVQYGSYIQDGILSVIIKASLQEGGRAQRTIIKTYNYSLEEDREINFSELLKLKKVEQNYAQEKIDKEIELGHKKAEDLKALGHTIFERNLNDSMYKVQNIKDFYYHDGSIYVIFAYGNEKATNEVDIAIL